MKSWVVLLVLIQHGLVSEAKPVDGKDQDLTSKEETCVESLHLDRNAIIKLNNQALVVDDHKDFNEFLECYWKKEEWINGEDEVDYQKILLSLVDMSAAELEDQSDELRAVVKQRITDAVTSCKNNPPPKGNTPGQTAIRVQNCLTIQAIQIINALLHSEKVDDAKLSSAEQECLNELNLNEDVLDVPKDEDIAANEDLGNFLVCSWQKEGIMDNDGEVDFGKLESEVQDQMMKLFKGETQNNKKLLEETVKQGVQRCKEKYIKTESFVNNIITAKSCIEVGFIIVPTGNKIYKMIGFSYL